MNFIQNFQNNKRETLFLLFLVSLISIWNIPNTIAARYSLEAALILILIFSKLDWFNIFRNTKVLIIFFLYLLIQTIFFTSEIQISLKNFKSEWMHFIIFSIIGVGAGLIFQNYKKQKILLIFGLAFASPLFIHLGLILLKLLETGSVPWGYWGISQIHGDFAYASLQASILILSYLLIQSNSWREKSILILLLILFFCSVLVAKSRGGIIFFWVACFFSIILFSIIKNYLYKRKILSVSLVLICFISGILALQISAKYDPIRWNDISTRLMMGFQSHPKLVYCQGIEVLKNELIEKNITLQEKEQKALASVEDGDGARVMAARAGLMLIPDNLMGINGSKQAYQIAITNYCGHAPQIFISHTHNAWIDTALAIGLIGVLLLLLYYFYLIYFSIKTLSKNNEINPYSFTLFLTATLWLLRGMLDSTLRDQMLEMQALMLSLLFTLSYKYKFKKT